MQRDDFLTFVAPGTSARTTALPNDFCMLITDTLESPATFLLTLLISRALRQPRNVVFVGLSDTFDHYAAICKKSGVQLANEHKNGRFAFVNGLGSSGSVVDLCQDVRTAVETAGPGAVLVLDDVSALLWLGNQTGDVVRAVTSLRALVSDNGGSMVMLMHADDMVSSGETDDSILFRRALQVSDLWLRTTVLSSQTRGELSIHRGPALVEDFGIVDRSGPTALQYKLDETGPTFSVKGLGRMW